MNELPEDKNVLLDIKPVEELIETQPDTPPETLEPQIQEEEDAEEPEEKIFKKKKRKKRTVTPKLRAHLARCREKSAIARRKKRDAKKKQEAEAYLNEEEEEVVDEPEVIQPIVTQDAPPPMPNEMDSFFNNFERFVNFVDKLDTVRDTRRVSTRGAPTQSSSPPLPPSPLQRRSPPPPPPTSFTRVPPISIPGSFEPPRCSRISSNSFTRWRS